MIHATASREESEEGASAEARNGTDWETKQSFNLLKTNKANNKNDRNVLRSIRDHAAFVGLGGMFFSFSFLPSLLCFYHLALCCCPCLVVAVW